jgi:catechol 2,3-dioxygenase-like lactoylglutathione lyase family enzyme
LLIDFNHTSFTVGDLPRSVEFYTRIVGLELISFADRPAEYSQKVTGVSGCPLRVAYLRGYGLTLELIEYVGSVKGARPSAVDNVGSGHICFNVRDLRAVVREWRQQGVRFKSEPQLIPAGTNKDGLVIYGEDPDGIVVELIEPPR